MNLFKKAKARFNIPDDLPNAYIRIGIQKSVGFENGKAHTPEFDFMSLDIFMTERNCSRERAKTIYDQIHKTIITGTSSFEEAEELEWEWTLKFTTHKEKPL